MLRDHEGNSKFDLPNRRSFVKILLTLGLPTTGFFTVQEVIAGKWSTALLLSLMLAVLIALFLTLRHPSEEREKEPVYRMLLPSFVLLFAIYLLSTIWVENSFHRLYWSYLFPVLIFYAIGSKTGLFFMSAFYLAIAGLVLSSDFSPIPQDMVKTRFLISFLFVSIAFFVSAYLMQRDQRKLLSNELALKKEIEDRERVEEVLRQSEERYRTILENIEDGYYETNLRGDLTFFNDALCRMLGYSREEMMGMGNKQYTDEENRKRLYQAFNEVYRTGKSAKGFEWQVIRKNGEKRFGEVSVSLIRDAHGEPIGFRGIARDTTERKQAEEALRTEKQRFETLLENAPFGMVLIDKEGDFKYINSKFVELFGYHLADIPNGRQWFRKAYPDPEYRHQVIETWISDSNLTTPGERIPRIFTATCKDGTRKTVRFITVLLETGEYLMSCEDITLVQKAEEEKKVLEEQLRQSQKMEAIGQLAGGIAHDFNNLLTVIRGYGQLSQMELNEKEKLKANLDEILKATQKASELTHQLLAFSRRQIMDMKVIDLNDLLKDLDKMLRRIIGEDIELNYLLSEDLGKVKADPSQIGQVILNLAVNARDAMPSGGKLTIETYNAEIDETYVRTHAGTSPGPYVVMSVTDTGEGMTPEVRERAFEPFFTTKGKGKGTGLGLSTCYGIVKQSGGNIWTYSEPGKGTTFKIYLPRVEGLSEEPREESEGGEILSGTETILAVEDEVEVRKLVAEILSGQGYHVIQAGNGEEALKVARENPSKRIHLLLTDVVMPGMSGRELATTLGLQHPEMKVLYMSGYTDNAIVHHGVLEEGVNYIQKPFTLEGLARKVREVLDRRG